jgi:hypothetical protein
MADPTDRRTDRRRQEIADNPAPPDLVCRTAWYDENDHILFGNGGRAGSAKWTAKIGG